MATTRWGGDLAGMRAVAYYAGRALQIAGLLAMPSAMWIAQFERNERLSIGIFVGSFAAFAAGYFLTKVSGKI